MNKREVDHFLKILEKTIESLAGIILALATVITILQVLFRYILKIPFVWSEEFTRFLFIWIVWLGAALAIPAKKHMVIEFIRDRIPNPWPKIIKLFTNLLALFFLIIVIVKGVSLVNMMAKEYYVTFPISVKYAYLASVIGGLLMVIFLLVDFRDTLKRFFDKRRDFDH
jgi:TRAP-type C4-dicarboxylate transport system permease small subunit